jgi:hypothetical protein
MDAKPNKQIKQFSGTNHDITAVDFLRKVNRDARAKLGFEPVEMEDGADPEGPDVPPNDRAFRDPHRRREWKHWAEKRAAIFGMYLTVPAETWYNEQYDANIEYFWDWNVATNAFVARFDNDTQKGASEIDLEKAKRNQVNP